MEGGVVGWPGDDRELVDLQHVLADKARDALVAKPWSPPARPTIGGCFVAFARGEAGPGHPGDRAWAAAVVWQPGRPQQPGGRAVDRHLRGTLGVFAPRPADDLLAQAVVAARVPARYTPGLLARREGPILASAVAALDLVPDVLLVDATGLDHPRGAGLALHLGAVVDVPTVGVTHRPLVARGPAPELRAGATEPLRIDGGCVGYWVCTRAGVRPVVAHAAWRTSPETAAQIVVAASTEAARTPVPLQEARRVAREARALANPDPASPGATKAVVPGDDQ